MAKKVVIILFIYIQNIPSEWFIDMQDRENYFMAQ